MQPTGDVEENLAQVRRSAELAAEVSSPHLRITGMSGHSTAGFPALSTPTRGPRTAAISVLVAVYGHVLILPRTRGTLCARTGSGQGRGPAEQTR
ncbi:carbon-nitrogen hydrolase family protein [Streptomyces cyaneofuscatus]|uniref:hypothetical protein n=1 Tax=Streptomyces cyaneofuscatus TaxID=66883 RepID=UPI0036A623C7